MSSRLRSRLRASTSLSGGGGGPAAALDLNFITGSYQTSGGSYAFQDLIRFSRTSAGTFVGSNGLIQNSPISNNLLLWTEEAENAAWTKTAVAVQSNLLLRSQEYDNASWVKNTSFIQTNLQTYSEQLDNAAWTKTDITVTANSIEAPDGAITADLLTEGSAGTAIISNSATTAASVVHTFSLYVKRGNTDWIRIACAGGVDNYIIWFNTATGTIGSNFASGAGVYISSSASSVGNGWYRVTVTGSVSATSTTCRVNSSIADGASTRVSGATYYLWGAQLVQGAEPGDYQRTEAAALAVGYTAPDGTLTADKLIPDSAAPFSSSYIRQNISKAANTTTYTSSVYAKAGEFNRIRLFVRENAAGANSAFVTVSLVDGSIVSAAAAIGTFTNASSTVTSVGSGWYRIALTFTTGTETNIWGQTVFAEDSVATTGDGASGIYVWGSQIVNGPVAEAYQPTAASVVAIQHLAPNGVLSANKIVENSANTYHFVRNPVTAANVAHTFTVYLKAGERSRVVVAMSDITTGDAFIGVDLTNGTTFTATGLSVGSWTSISSSVTSVGSGWYRVSVTATKGAGTQIAGCVFPTNGTSATFLGDGSSGFYMWGSQLEVGSSATAYSRNADGRYAPRFDYDPVTLVAKGLLIEEQRTNLLTYSEQFNNAAWTKLSMTVTADSVVAPDGQTTADTLTGTASSFCYVTQVTPTLTTGVNYTLSRYVKAGTINFCTLALHAQADVYFDLVNLTYNAVGTGFVSAAIVDVGNGWRRISATWTKDAGTTYQIYLALASSLSSQSGIPIGATLYSWGAQFEAGSFVTSYIPTVASTVTRAADIALVTGGAFTPWYNPLAGTLSADVIPQLSNVANQFIASLSDGTNINRASIFKSTGGIGGFRTTSNGTAANPIAPANALTGNVAHKIALAITTGTGNVMPAVDGALGTAATLSTMPTGVNTLRFGVNEAANADWLNGHTRRVRYFNTRLTNAELQTVTT